jgi:hypothetical protein
MPRRTPPNLPTCRTLGSAAGSPAWPSLLSTTAAEVLGMTTPPSWTDADWTARIAEPFRSDGEFWTSLAASADALVSLVAAIALAVVLVLAGDRDWSALPFLLPAGLAVRAVVIARSSSRRNRAAFADHESWRDAERGAVAAAFGRALRRSRIS